MISAHCPNFNQSVIYEVICDALTLVGQSHDLGAFLYHRRGSVVNYHAPRYTVQETVHIHVKTSSIVLRKTCRVCVFNAESTLTYCKSALQ